MISGKIQGRRGGCHLYDNVKGGGERCNDFKLFKGWFPWDY